MPGDIGEHYREKRELDRQRKQDQQRENERKDLNEVNDNKHTDYEKRVAGANQPTR